jgi:hypothetical protein
VPYCVAFWNEIVRESFRLSWGAAGLAANHANPSNLALQSPFGSRRRTKSRDQGQGKSLVHMLTVVLCIYKLPFGRGEMQLFQIDTKIVGKSDKPLTIINLFIILQRTHA